MKPTDLSLWTWKDVSTKNASQDVLSAHLDGLPRIAYDAILGPGEVPPFAHRVTIPEDAQRIMTFCGWQHRPASSAPKLVYDLLRDAGRLVLPARPSDSFLRYMDSVPPEASMEECYKESSFRLDPAYYRVSEGDETDRRLLEEGLEWQAFDASRVAWLHGDHPWQRSPPDTTPPSGMRGIYLPRRNTKVSWMPEYVQKEFRFVNEAYRHLGAWVEFAKFIQSVGDRARVEAIVDLMVRVPHLPLDR